MRHWQMFKYRGLRLLPSGHRNFVGGLVKFLAYNIPGKSPLLTRSKPPKEAQNKTLPTKTRPQIFPHTKHKATSAHPPKK